MKISLELSEKIESTLQKYVSSPEPDWVVSDKTINLRKIASELNVLPLYKDWDGTFGIRSTGEFFSFSYKKPDEIRTTYNQREINGILVRGLKKYSELQELMPTRTTNSIECSDCGETGISPMNEKLGFTKERIVCFCGALGRLPNENKL
jgi:hypothetical protein